MLGDKKNADLLYQYGKGERKTKYMRDNRIEKIKQHYTIILNDKHLKVLKHKIDIEKSLVTIKTKVFGQDFPHGDNILASFSEDGNQPLVISWAGMYKDEKIECWKYRIIT